MTQRTEVLPDEEVVAIPAGEFRKLLLAFEKVKALEAAGVAKLEAYQEAVKPVYDKWYGPDEPAEPADPRQDVAVDNGAPTA